MEAALSASEPAPGVLTAEELCRRYAPSVCRFAAMMARSSPDADDLAQDALLRAVRAVRSYDASRGTPAGLVVANRGQCCPRFRPASTARAVVDRTDDLRCITRVRVSRGDSVGA